MLAVSLGLGTQRQLPLLNQLSEGGGRASVPEGPWEPETAQGKGHRSGGERPALGHACLLHGTSSLSVSFPHRPPSWSCCAVNRKGACEVFVTH